MKVLVVGGGGREHAFCWRLGRSDSVEQVYAVPGNAGIAQKCKCFSQDIKSDTEILALAQHLDADLTVIGPEAPLVSGLADKFRAHDLPVIGPGAEAAQLEGSKIFSKQFMRRHGIPTADFVVVESINELEANLARFGFPVALKADGLAAGKGVIIVRDEDEARETGAAMLSGKVVGDAGRRLLIEQFMTGEEVSFIVLSDGRTFFEFPPSQDHKTIFDNDLGPNTGGMGAYCDPRILREKERQVILTTIVEKTLKGIRSDGNLFVGFLYCGLMMTEDGPQVLEYNVRMGDPETQPLMYRMAGDVGELLLSTARGSLNPETVGWDEGPTCCVVCAAPGYPGSYPQGLSITGIDKAEATGAKVFHAGTALRGENLVTAGGRVLGVTAGGKDLASAIGNAYAAVEKIQFDGLYYRKDIGQKGLCRW
jgi:phosphoribosylamine--glycine ligase